MPKQSSIPGKPFDPAVVDGTAQGIGAATVGMNTGSARRHDNRVLASLPEADLALVARHLHVVLLKPGTVLEREGDPLEHVYFPHEGLVSLLAITPEGQTIEAASVGRGGAVCPLLDSDGSANFLSAAPFGALRASRIAAARLQALERESEALGRALAACREELLLQLRQRIVCSGLHSVEQRLARWLLDTADRLEAGVMPIPVTQEEVGERLGVRRTSVTLLATTLQDAGAIRWRRSRVEIIDRARLEQMACCCYAALRERTRALLG